MKKRKVLTGILATAIAMSTMPVQVMAADSPLATYQGSATVFADEDEDFENYDITVDVTVENGLVSDVSINSYSDSYSSENESYVDWALNGRTKKNATYTGLADQLKGKSFQEVKTMEIDAVSGATCTSYAIHEAVKDALSKAEAEASETRYVMMNVPYKAFYEAYGITDAAVWEVEPGLDAVSTATTSKFKGTTGLANGTYNNGLYIMGVTIPVAIDAELLESLGTLAEGADYYYTDCEGTPEFYSSVTKDPSGTLCFSQMQAASVDTGKLSVGELTTSSGYGDYQISLIGVGTNKTIATTDGEKAYKAIYGAILNTDQGSFGMTALENLWFGTKTEDVEVAWSIKGGKGLKRAHGQGDPFYQFDMNGGTLNSVDLITDLGVITIESGLELPVYYTDADKLANISYAIDEDSTVMYINGLPEELENVNVTVSGGLADKAEIVDGKVQLNKAPVAGTSYNLSINSSNYAAITRTMSTPITANQKAELNKWVEKAKATDGYTDNATLVEQVKDANALVEKETATSVEAANLIKKLTESVKACYETIPGAAVTLNAKAIRLSMDVELSKLENPTYQLTTGSGRMQKTVASGSLNNLEIILDEELAKDTEYKLTIVADNYRNTELTATVSEEVIEPEPVVGPNGLSDTKAEDGNWYYLKNGKADLTYTGLAKNKNGWWYVKDGKVDFGKNSVEKNEYGWWKIKNGKVDFNYTGIAKNANGWWRIVNGKVDFGCNSVEKNEYGWWKIKNGKVDFNYTGVAKNANGWWRIVNGKVDFNFTGLAKNEYGWWYLEKGKVNFAYTGYAKNSAGTWYVKGGKVQFESSGKNAR